MKIEVKEQGGKRIHLNKRILVKKMLRSFIYLSCCDTSLKNGPSASMSSSNVPNSATQPPFSMAILSDSFIVDNLCAIEITVRP